MPRVKRKTFRPGLSLTIFAAGAFVILCALGVWQLQRLSWKIDLLANIELQRLLPSEPLPANLSDDLLYRLFQLNGRYHPAQSDTLFGRSYKGATGLLALTPFETLDGRWFVVNRGWVPLSKEDPSTWQTSEDQIEITGILRASAQQSTSWFKPQNDPDGAHLFFIEPAMIAKRKSLPELEPYYVDLTEDGTPSDQPPLKAATAISIPNNHLQYALTWFFFAAIVAVIYVLLSLKPKDEVA